MTATSKKVTVILDPEIRAVLCARAERQGISLTTATRQALEALVKASDGEAGDFRSGPQPQTVGPDRCAARGNIFAVIAEILQLKTV